MRVTSVAQGNRWVDATGTVAQVESTFKTTLRYYRHGGQRVREATSALSIPRSMATSIAGIIGVSSAPLHRTAVEHPKDAPPPQATCASYWDQHEQVAPLAYGRTSFPTRNCGYSPAQLRSAYGVQSAVSHGNDGHGVTVAIIDAYSSPTIVADANALATLQGEPALTRGQFSETDVGQFEWQDVCDPDTWNIEESLDVESVHGMAPGARIRYIGAADCGPGIDDAVNYVLQNHVANLVSNSYGFFGEDDLGDEVTLEHSEFVQAALEGVGFYFSSGDSGDNTQDIDGTPHPEPDYPVSDPLVTGVGGTTLALDRHNGYLFETSWGDDADPVDFSTSPSSLSLPLPGEFLFGGGGGVSALFGEPLYQRLAVPGSLARLNGPTPMRVAPDVAAVGDPETGFLTIVGGVSVNVGGTSLAAPVFTGIQALASQDRHFPIGFANPLLYILGLTHVAFHDVTAPKSAIAVATQSGFNLLTLGHDTSLTATRGYDDSTGLGTPDGPGFLLGERLVP